MNETKKPYQSKTIILNAIVGVSVALTPFIPALAPVKSFIEQNAIMIGSIYSVLAIFLRYISKDKIVLVD